MHIKSLLLAVLMPLNCAMAANPDWSIYTHNVENQATMVNGSLVGVAHAGKRAYFIEVVRSLMQELGIKANIVEVPYARGMLYVTSSDGVVFFNISRIPERENQVAWVGPVLSETSYLYELANNPVHAETLDDVRHKAVCVLNKNVHDIQLTALGFTDLHRANTYSECFRRLVGKQVEFVASGGIGLQQKLQMAKIDAHVVRRTPIIIGQDDSYIALSKGTPKEETERWESAFKKLKDHGKIAALHKQFIPPDD